MKTSVLSSIVWASCVVVIGVTAACGDSDGGADTPDPPAGDAGTTGNPDAGSPPSSTDSGAPPAATYTVGGTVSGLEGAGLVLQNNAGDDLTVSGNGSFTFAARVKSGGDYAVTVKTQPADPTQTCAVGSGTGKVASSNVTSIAVTCSTNTYTVGGTVTGLDGGTVVLTNGGGDDATVAIDGAFTFTTKVPSGGDYDVAVKTQPEGRHCTIANGSGEVGGANVSNVTVTCVAATSCMAIKTVAPNATSGVYSIKPANTAYPVYCDMVTAGGGWTLAMKGAADSTEFVYSSTHWTTGSVLNADQTDLDVEDAKFQAFNDMPFAEVRLATTNTEGDGAIVVPNPTANTTLLSRFDPSLYQEVDLDRDAWLASQAGTVLQLYCNRGGFNVDRSYVKARIGFEANQEDDCSSSDSVVGVGVWAAPSCGNSTGAFNAGYHSGPTCGDHGPNDPAVPGRAASFRVWIR